MPSTIAPSAGRSAFMHIWRALGVGPRPKLLGVLGELIITSAALHRLGRSHRLIRDTAAEKSPW
jgi:hypothetical protein